MTFRNRGTRPAEVNVLDRYTSHTTKVSLKPGQAHTEPWSLHRTQGWYDLVVTLASEAGFRAQYAGHIENGEDSITDPAMGGLIQT